MSEKRNPKRKNPRNGSEPKPRVERLPDADVGCRLEHPIQTALYAKLWRLGYET